MKVAILGLSEATRAEAPWADESVEKWGLAWDPAWAHMHRLFEMHDRTALAILQPPEYLNRLREIWVPLYMQEAYEDLPAIRYPFASVAHDIGAPYWNSSVAYMVALAIHEGVEEIGIYGVEMRADDEYGYQRPNMEYLIGVARGKGIKVLIPDESPLCKFQQVGPHVTYLDRYGSTE